MVDVANMCTDNCRLIKTSL